MSHYRRDLGVLCEKILPDVPYHNMIPYWTQFTLRILLGVQWCNLICHITKGEFTKCACYERAAMVPGTCIAYLETIQQYFLPDYEPHAVQSVGFAFSNCHFRNRAVIFSFVRVIGWQLQWPVRCHGQKWQSWKKVDYRLYSPTVEENISRRGGCSPLWQVWWQIVF